MSAGGAVDGPEGVDPEDVRPTEPMPAQPRRSVVTVTFDLTGRRGDYAVDEGLAGLKVGGLVVVESRRGKALGRVLRAAHRPKKGGGRIRRVLREAGEEDIERQRAAEARIPEIFRAALQEIRDRQLDLKVVAASPQALAERVTLYLVGSDRVDPEVLGKAIGARIGLRVDIKQLGRREETKVVGGLGRCGQELCCSTFLPTFPATSIRQAKDQGMALAADRTSGVCGKTLCCLSYEADLYSARRKFLPKTGKRAKTTDGQEGRVIGVDVMRGTFTLLDTDRGKRQVLPAEAWDKNQGRQVPPPEFPRSLAAPKTGGLRDRIGNADALPGAPPPSPDAAPKSRAPAPEPKRASKRRRGRGRRPEAPREDS